MLWVRISIRSRCTTLCDKVCQWLATGRWFSPDTPVSSTNKTGRHYIYKWNIVGSGVKHHTPTIQPLLFVVWYHEIRILRIFSVSIFYCSNIMQIHYFDNRIRKQPNKCLYQSVSKILHTLKNTKVCQWLAVSRFSPVSSTNTTDRLDITEILLNVSLNTITLIPKRKLRQDNR